MYTSVATFAISAIWNNNLIKNPALWEEQRLTQMGKQLIQGINMSSLLGVDVAVPFFLPERQPNWHIVDAPTRWSFHNLVNFVGKDFALAGFFDGTDYFYVLFCITLITAVVVVLVFLAIAMLFRLLGKHTVFAKLPVHTRLIVVIHAAFAMTLLVQLVPYSVFILPVWFGPDVLGQLERFYSVPFTCAIMHGIMYAGEAMTRSVVKVSHLLLWHHVLWFILLFIAAIKKSMFAIKVDFILEYFICWEFALYVCLVAHRLEASLRLQKRLLIIAAVTYGGSRLVQAVLLLSLFIVGGARMKPQPGLYSIMLILTVALVVLQTYTGWIYWAMWQRASQKSKSANVAAAEPAGPRRLEMQPAPSAELLMQGSTSSCTSS